MRELAPIAAPRMRRYPPGHGSPGIFLATDYLRGLLSVTELCELYGVSRKTAYKWIERYLRHGPAGLSEQSRRPWKSPNQTAPEVVEALLQCRGRHPSWGAKKLLTLLHKSHPRWDLPGRSIVCDILSRAGMVPKQRQRILALPDVVAPSPHPPRELL